MQHTDWPARWLQQSLGYVAKDLTLFTAALTHRSAAGRNNERLEFLGDAVLNMLVAELLYSRFPEADEGDLSRLRASLVSAEPLAGLAHRLGLGEELKLGSGELKTGGFRRQSILADAFEATIGAVYLDRGFDAARELVNRLWMPLVEALPQASALKDPKTRLQEWLQSRGLGLPVYVVESVEGEPHAQHFTVRCEVAALEAATSGEGSSRRKAEQEAAQRVLEKIEGRS
ncbi:MAG: ribonuclease III [Gammaproteobacteria bacterium]